VSRFLYILFGPAVAMLSGLIGIGGGTIIVLTLVLLFGFSQHAAPGTTPALLASPIGFPAARTCYRQGYVDITVDGLVRTGFFVGGFFVAKIATVLSAAALERISGAAFPVIAFKMIFAG